MKRELLSLTLCLAATSMLLVACNKEQPFETDAHLANSAQISLEKDFGGYTTSAEAPMFGDGEVIAESAEDAIALDPVSYEVSTNLAMAPGLKAYEIRLAWGLLEGDSTATELIDWSGRVCLSSGVLAVLKVIRFERELQGDRLHLPRTSRRELAFTSHTDTNYDGLLLLVVDTGTSDTPGEFSIQTRCYNRKFTFNELDSLNLVEPAGNRYAISIISRSGTVNRFDNGFLAGRWVKDNDQQGGFRGRWINSEGENTGALQGIWGVRRNGEQVFFGKHVGLNGEFGGLLAGHWQYDGNDSEGVFEGRWFNRDRQEGGKLAGHFKIGALNDNRGFFQGLWVKHR